MEFLDAITLTIIVGSFISSFINAAFATGGAMLMLAISASVLPVSAIVPLHSAFMYGSLTSRCYYFHEHIAWHIVVPFALGCVIGTTVGARVYLDLPGAWIALVIGVLMLVSTWFPKVDWKIPLKHPFFAIGIIHSLLSTLFSFGAILHSVVLHTNLVRQQIIATLATSLVMMATMKIIGYTVFGFDYLPYISLIIGATVAGFAGTAVGKRVTHTMPENWFRLGFRALMTLLALRLLYRAWDLFQAGTAV